MLLLSGRGISALRPAEKNDPNKSFYWYLKIKGLRVKNTREANKKPVSFETWTNALNLNINLPNILNRKGIFSESTGKKTSFLGQFLSDLKPSSSESSQLLLGPSCYFKANRIIWLTQHCYLLLIISRVEDHYIRCKHYRRTQDKSQHKNLHIFTWALV